MRAAVTIEKRELLPLLVIEKGADHDGWFRDRTELAGWVHALQTRNESVSEGLTGTSHPYEFTYRGRFPFSDVLVRDLNDLSSKGLIKIKEVPRSEKALIIDHEFSITDVGKRNLDAAIDALRTEHQSINIEAVIKNLRTPPKSRGGLFHRRPVLPYADY